MDTKFLIDARIIQELGLLNNDQVKAIAREYESCNIASVIKLLDQLDLQTLKVIEAYCSARRLNNKVDKEIAEIML